VQKQQKIYPFETVLEGIGKILFLFILIFVDSQLKMFYRIFSCQK